MPLSGFECLCLFSVKPPHEHSPGSKVSHAPIWVRALCLFSIPPSTSIHPEVASCSYLGSRACVCFVLKNPPAQRSFSQKISNAVVSNTSTSSMQT